MLPHRALICALAILCPACAVADAGSRPPDPSPAFLTAVSENDNYAPLRQDRHYTNGALLSYGFPRGYGSRWMDWLGALTPLADAPTDREYDIAVGHNMYTPPGFALSRALPGDRPFAAWLYGELGVTTRAPGVEEQLAISLGVVGPAAQGELGQKLIHAISGDREPQGWHNQIRNEAALLLRYGRSWFLPLADGGDFAVDLVPRIGFALGNVVTEAGAGAVARFGSTLFQRDGPRRLQPGLSGASMRFDVRPGRFDWFVYAGGQGRAVARNIFLDGNSFRDSLSVDRETMVWDVEAGLALVFGQLERPVMLAFGLVRRSREFRGQNGPDSFGSAQLSVRF